MKTVHTLGDKRLPVAQNEDELKKTICIFDVDCGRQTVSNSFEFRYVHTSHWLIYILSFSSITVISFLEELSNEKNVLIEFICKHLFDV